MNPSYYISIPYGMGPILSFRAISYVRYTLLKDFYFYLDGLAKAVIVNVIATAGSWYLCCP